ncbi:MAG: DUF5680 domain-containing protein [Patescibacteria group bacterium]|jgi:hypothetical protein
MSALPTVAETMAFFMMAKNETYASGKESKRLPFFPKAKMMTFGEGDFRYIDTWLSYGKPNKYSIRYSFGITVIFYRGKPIWLMWYQGWWRSNVPGVLNFLRRALAAATEFRGGRGPGFFREGDGMSYTNAYDDLWDLEKTFTDFRGHDLVNVWENKSPHTVYYHDYGGFALVDLPE